MKPAMLWVALAAGTTLWMIGAVAPRPSLRAQTGASVAEQYLLASANRERLERGLPELRWDGALAEAARAHAAEMAARESISHGYPGEPGLADRGRRAGARFSVIAENVAEAPTSVRIHDAWMNSEGHRHNLLDPQVDAVGISVLRRNGQLYAVEDFEHAVAALGLTQQERAVEARLNALPTPVPLAITVDNPAARETCAAETGYSGPEQPWFVMRYTSGDLGRLPHQLTERLATGKYHRLVVGACPPASGEAFSSYRIAVLLYP